MASDSRTGQRFALALPARIGAGTRQRRGTTRNLSSAGVLMEADPSLRIGTRVQFSITLPHDLLGVRSDVDVECEGRVVRIEKPRRVKSKKDGERVSVACIIDDYSFVRRKKK